MARVHRNRALWHGHEMTPAQASLFDQPDQSAKKPTQADLIAAELRKHREQGTALALPEIMRLGVAQHGARLRELRLKGFRIENEMTRTADGIHSIYRLTFDPAVGK